MFNLWEDLGAGTIMFIKAHVAYFASLIALYTMDTFLHESPFESGIFLSGFLFFKLSIMGLMAFGVTLITLLYAIRVFVMILHFHQTCQHQADEGTDHSQGTSSRGASRVHSLYIWILVNFILAIALLVLIFALWVADRLDFKLDESNKELFRRIVAFNGRLSEAVFLVLFLIMAVKLLGMALDGLRTQVLKMPKVVSSKAVNAVNQRKRSMFRKKQPPPAVTGDVDGYGPGSLGIL